MTLAKAPVKAPVPQLSFISISHPDEIKGAHVKRHIHQYVMKDIGFSRRKKKGKRRESSHTVPEPATALVNDGPDCNNIVTLVKTAAAATPKQPANPSLRTDVVLHSPAVMRARSINEFLFRRNSAFCMKIRELCFSLAMVDDGVYCLALAEKALHGDEPANYSLPHEENALSLGYYMKSVYHVHQHMQSLVASKSINHEILGAVLGLASYDLSVGNMQRWQVHMAALRSLMNHRGGLSSYPSVFFRLSLLWTETTGGLILDKQPYFSIPLDSMQPFQKPVIRPVLTRNLTALRSFHQSLDVVAHIMELMTGTAESHALKDAFDMDSDCYAIYCITRARVSYLLLQIPRADPLSILDETASMADVLQEAIRLAALIFLIRLVGFVPAVNPDSHGWLEYHAARLGKLLAYHDRLWPGMQELQLWVLAIATVAIGDVSQSAMLASRAAVIMDDIGMSWDDLPMALHEIVWVKEIFDTRLYEMQSLVKTLSVSQHVIE